MLIGDNHAQLLTIATTTHTHWQTRQKVENYKATKAMKETTINTPTYYCVHQPLCVHGKLATMTSYVISSHTYTYKQNWSHTHKCWQCTFRDTFMKKPPFVLQQFSIRCMHVKLCINAKWIKAHHLDFLLLVMQVSVDWLELASCGSNQSKHWHHRRHNTVANNYSKEWLYHT